MSDLDEGYDEGYDEGHSVGWEQGYLAGQEDDEKSMDVRKHIDRILNDLMHTKGESILRDFERRVGDSYTARDYLEDYRRRSRGAVSDPLFTEIFWQYLAEIQNALGGRPDGSRQQDSRLVQQSRYDDWPSYRSSYQVTPNPGKVNYGTYDKFTSISS